MATHSSTLAWKIPWMEEPGRLQSMVGGGGTKSRTRLSDFTFKHSGPLRTAPRIFCFGVFPWLCSLHQPDFVFCFSSDKADLSFLEHLLYCVCIPAPEPWRQEPFCALQADTEDREDQPCWSAENVIFWMQHVFQLVFPLITQDALKSVSFIFPFRDKRSLEIAYAYILCRQNQNKLIFPASLFFFFTIC